MSAAKHSPGPWAEGSHRTVVDANGSVVCVVWSGPCGIDVADAHQQLIADAPELLQALRELQANPNDMRAHRRALDAIAKATRCPK